MFLIKVALIVTLALPMSTIAEEQCNQETAVKIATKLKGLWEAWMIATAVQFDIAEHLRKHPLTNEELAHRTGTDPGALLRLMRALRYFKVFREDAHGKWANTQMSMHLTDDENCSLKDMATLLVRDDYTIWPNFYKAIKTGKPLFPNYYGEDYWEFLARRPQRARTLTDAAGEIVRVFNKDIAKMYDFTPYKHIVDISGNDGTLITMLLKAAPQAKGTIFDMEYYRKDAMEYTRKHGVIDRVTYVNGDFLKTMPEGGDLYVMKQAFHDWQDPEAMKILTLVANQMRKKPAKMLIINQILPKSNEPIPEHVWEVYTWMMVGGTDRTRTQYETLFKKAGLRLNKLIPTNGTIPDIMELVLDSEK